MMSMSDPLSAAQTETYFDQHYSQDEYYSQGQTCIGHWIGKGAADLGLAGDVSREDFSALLQGINPRSGAVFIPAATHNHEHRAGWDSVFSAPKSVSIQALIGGDGRLIHAHRRAVERALVEVEAYALARQRGGSEYVVSGKVVGAAFNHLAARPADDVRLPDPQLHTHVVLLNMTRRPDGEWRSMDPVAIYGAQRLGSAVYRSELAREVQRLGYRIQVTAGDGAWELEGYTRAQVMAFSQRRQDIQQRMAAQGLSGPKAAQIVALNSRQAKRDYDEAELKADWQKRAQEAGIDAKQHLHHALGRGDMNRGNPADAHNALDFAQRHTTEREAVVDRRELEATALQHGMGHVDLTAVRKAMDTAQHLGALIPAEKTDWHRPRGAFTTDEMVRLEAENLAMRRAGINQAPPIADSQTVRQWATAKGLSDEQKNAAELALSSSDRITAIEGLAGTAKTHTVGAIRELAEAQGYAVRGFGMTSGSVKELKRVGLEARTIASLTSNPVPQTDKPQLWFIDESSLLATRPVNQLLKIARREGVAHISVVGDQHQHLAIEAGHPMSQFLGDGMPVAELTTIRRQRDAELRKAVEQASQGKAGAAARAIDLLDQQHRLSEVSDAKERYQRIAADYLRGHQAGQQTLVVSPGNDERRMLNQEIRKLLVEQGYVAASGRVHDILVPRQEMTKSKIAHARYYDAGDVIHFERAHKRQGIAKDAYLTVQTVDRASNLLTLQYPYGRTIEVSPARWGKSVQVYTQEQRAIAVGDRLEYRIHNRKRDIANHELATVIRLDGNQATVKFDNGRVLKGALSPHLDLGYCSTSHSAQGATVDRVIVNLDSMRSAQLVNQRSFYVTISRGREDARVYTNDADALRNAVKREPRKEVALEVIIQPPQQQRQSSGLRI